MSGNCLEVKVEDSNVKVNAPVFGVIWLLAHLQLLYSLRMSWIHIYKIFVFIFIKCQACNTNLTFDLLMSPETEFWKKNWICSFLYKKKSTAYWVCNYPWQIKPLATLKSIVFWLCRNTCNSVLKGLFTIIAKYNFVKLIFSLIWVNHTTAKKAKSPLEMHNCFPHKLSEL